MDVCHGPMVIWCQELFGQGVSSSLCCVGGDSNFSGKAACVALWHLCNPVIVFVLDDRREDKFLDPDLRRAAGCYRVAACLVPSRPAGPAEWRFGCGHNVLEAGSRREICRLFHNAIAVEFDQWLFQAMAPSWLAFQQDPILGIGPANLRFLCGELIGESSRFHLPPSSAYFLPPDAW